MLPTVSQALRGQLPLGTKAAPGEVPCLMADIALFSLHQAAFLPSASGQAAPPAVHLLCRLWSTSGPFVASIEPPQLLLYCLDDLLSS